MIAGIVSEGPTDFPILRAFIETLWPEIEQVLPIQPEGDETAGSGVRTTGWTGVKAWCEKYRGWLGDYLGSGLGPPIAILAIQVDLDVAGPLSIRRGRTTQVAKTAAEVCTRVRTWLGPKIPTPVVIAVPAQSIETWGAAAVKRLGPGAELERNPAQILMRARMLARGRDGKPMKDPASFDAIAQRVSRNLDRVRTTCPEADRFARKIEARRHHTPDSSN